MSIKDKFHVRAIKTSECKEWLLEVHYAKRLPSISFAFGLYKTNELVGVMTIGKPASPFLCRSVCGDDYASYVFELNRLCVINGLEKNVLSYFVGRSLRSLTDNLILVSYADTAYGHHGYIYQATNWIYTGVTKERTDRGLEDGSHARHYDKGLDAKMNRKKRSAKHRYVYFVGSMKKQFHAHLRYPIYVYPKGQNQYYDVNHQPIVQLRLL